MFLNRNYSEKNIGIKDLVLPFHNFIKHFLLLVSLSDCQFRCFVCYWQPDVVINCAAISVPRACEIDPDTANAINVPSSLVKWLQSFKQNSPLLIHLSTDQGKPILS